MAALIRGHTISTHALAAPIAHAVRQPTDLAALQRGWPVSWRDKIVYSLCKQRVKDGWQGLAGSFAFTCN